MTNARKMFEEWAAQGLRPEVALGLHLKNPDGTFQVASVESDCQVWLAALAFKKPLLVDGKSIVTKLRNPWGLSLVELDQNRLHAADYIEGLEDALKSLREHCAVNGLDTVAYVDGKREVGKNQNLAAPYGASSALDFHDSGAAFFTKRIGANGYVVGIGLQSHEAAADFDKKKEA